MKEEELIFRLCLASLGIVLNSIEQFVCVREFIHVAYHFEGMYASPRNRGAYCIFQNKMNENLSFESYK